MKQDFSKKIAIVVSRQLESWQVLNTVGHIAAYIGNKMQDKFDTGDYFKTKDSIQYPRNSQFPLIVLSVEPQQLSKLMANIKESCLLYIAFIQEMIETTHDEEIEKILESKNDSEIEYLGIGFFGENDQVNKLTKKFSLWK